MSNPRPFQAEVSQVLRLVVNSLYSNKEVFLRELVSNASDALDKLRFRSLSQPELLPEGTEFRIRITPNSEAKTLTISDNGIGMTDDDLANHLGTIAKSGTREFAAQLQAAQESGNAQLIGQFGVGFYSAFLVADKVEVVSRAAGADAAFRWVSEGKDTFLIEPAERETQGTDIVLHLKDEADEYLKGWRLRELIGRYSDYIGHPVEMPTVATEDPKKEPEWERVNRASALWQRNPKDVTQEQYDEFYKHLSHDWEPPVARRHFKVEGTQMFAGMVFVPKRPPFDLFDRQSKHGVRLHVRRVFVMDDCQDLLPVWLRFIKGVVDSEDLPLNVSRETLQDNKIIKVMQKQVVNNCLSMLEELANDKNDDYLAMWKSFGAVLKEGFHFSAEHRDRLAKLARFESTKAEGLTSLDEYVSRMKEGQKAIYYATGASRALLVGSPHLERLKKHDYEVLLLTDPVDPFAIAGLPKYGDFELQSAMDDKLEIQETSEDEKKQFEDDKKRAEPLIERFTSALSDKVSEVRASSRLSDSPVCLVVPEGGIAPHIEQLMRAQNPDLPPTKRILEINPTHPVIERLNGALSNADASWVDDWMALLYDQALIAEGSPIDDPAAFSRRLSAVMSRT